MQTSRSICSWHTASTVCALKHVEARTDTIILWDVVGTTTERSKLSLQERLTEACTSASEVTDAGAKDGRGRYRGRVSGCVPVDCGVTGSRCDSCIAPWVVDSVTDKLVIVSIDNTREGCFAATWRSGTITEPTAEKLQ